MTKKRYFVDFGPELLQLLGPNLYTNIYYVLGELIANAYDADAENVYIIYNADTNTIIVEDDGNGMTYEDFNSRFLPIGIPSRTDERNAYTEMKKRKRMGRKGIGKLAALSVAERVKVISTRNGDKSGCILSLNISKKNENGKYEIPAIPEEEIHFVKIDESKSGSAIIMENSRYSLNKTIESAKRNISLIFPFTSDDFKIHLYDMVTGNSTTIDDSTSEIIKLADALITFSDPDSPYHDYLIGLHKYFDNDRYYKQLLNEIPESELPPKKNFNKMQGAITEKLNLVTNSGETKEFNLVIYGWIATYASTRERQKSADFSANHISLIANKKLGQFDILPDISFDKMMEAYVVGRFYVDLLEETELPDIASSNRQGYKQDDERYQKTLMLIREKALRSILDLKNEAAAVKNHNEFLRKQQQLKSSKENFDKIIKEITENPEFKKVITESKKIKDDLERALELKETLKETYKKVMISHCSKDKELIDELEKVLHYCGFKKEELLYTSSNYIESKIEPYVDIYEYLREFFVNTTRRPDLCVIYIVNEEFIRRWNPVLEAGAGWVLRTNWFPMYTDRIESIKEPFSNRKIVPKLSFDMDETEVRVLASAVKKISEQVGKLGHDVESIFHFIKTSTRLYRGA